MTQSDNNKTFDRQYIELDTFEGHGLYVGDPERFFESIFRDNYYDGFVNVGKLIRDSKAFSKQHDSEERLNDERFYNSISFFGERGVGKTSVMYSFVKALENNKYSEFIKKYRERYGTGAGFAGQQDNALVSTLEEYEFHTLDVIDVSLLEEKESIVDVILTKLYEQFVLRVDEFKRPIWKMKNQPFTADDVRKSMANVYEGYHLVRSGKDNQYAPRFSVEILKGLSGSFHVRQNIYKLIEQFLNVFCGTNDKHFLVICIDDIDLSTHGFDILEDLHRYFMIPNVIICLTANSKDLHRICVRHFRNTHGLKDSSEKSESNNMAITYLEKVLPVDNRIHMTSLLDKNCFVRLPVKSFDKARPEYNIWTIKQFMLHKIAERTLSYYDGVGLKKHFYEVSNMRTLRNLYHMLYEMPVISLNSDDNKQTSIYNQITANLSKLHEDIVGRMATELITDEKGQEIFKRFCEEDLARRCSLLIDWLFSTYDKGQFYKEYSQYGYSYGEFIRAINVLSSDRPEQKGLVRCILAESSISMTRLYYSEVLLKEVDSNYHKRLHREWNQLIGKSVVGSYANKFFPVINIKYANGSKGVNHFGYEEKREFLMRHKVNYDFDGIHGNVTPVSYIKWCKKLLGDGFADAFYFVGMFLKDIEYINLQSPKSIYLLDHTRISGEKYPKEETIDDYQEQIVLKQNVSKFTFDIFGFVITTRDLETYKTSVRSMLYEMFDDAGKKLFDGKWTDNHRKQIVDYIKGLVFYGEKEEIKSDGTTYPLPLHCVDIMYNIFKRIKNTMREKYGNEVSYNANDDKDKKNNDIGDKGTDSDIYGNDIIVDSSNDRLVRNSQVSKIDLVKMIQTCFEEIRKELESEDLFFNTEGTAITTKMEESFSKHPLVQFILSFDKRDDAGNKLGASDKCEQLFVDLLTSFVMEDKAAETK